MCSVFLFVFFFFKQKTAYEMRISDWSSDVCSSDLLLSCPLIWLPDFRSYCHCHLSFMASNWPLIPERANVRKRPVAGVQSDPKLLESGSTISRILSIQTLFPLGT